MFWSEWHILLESLPISIWSITFLEDVTKFIKENLEEGELILFFFLLLEARQAAEGGGLQPGFHGILKDALTLCVQQID